MAAQAGLQQSKLFSYSPFSLGLLYKLLHAHALDNMKDIKTNTCKCLLFLNSVKDPEVLFIFCKTIHDFSSHIKVHLVY